MTPKKDKNRQYMELAIEMMRRSVSEPRTDGKATPRVGAVLVKPDGKVETAYRGELRDGDHAEFTLLERKNRDVKLEGSLLFATLEPCAPNARKHPKLGCAERIALARIKEVWVGIEDPDPTVDRKGIKFLQDSGVKVHMFDRDLQEIIRAENKDFIAQALERAAAVEEETPKVVLSTLENTPAHSVFDDLSSSALEAYRSRAKIPDLVGSPAFNRRLASLGLLQQNGDQFIPTGFGVLLFGKEPRTAMLQAGLLGTIHDSNGKEEIRNFDGPHVFVPDQAIQWLRDKLPAPIDRSEARRREVNASLFEMAREGIVNALVHRDYSIQGAKCQLVVTPDTVVIRSPGRTVEPITLEQMQAFSAPMLSRNPALHFVFAQMELAEERGLGLRSMRDRAQAAGLPLPAYSWDDPYLVLTLYRSPGSAICTIPATVLAALSAEERKGWEFIASQSQLSRAVYERHMGFDKRKAQRHLGKFCDLGLLRRKGASSSTEYEVCHG